MGKWMATVYFPDGKRVFADYYTYSCGIGGDLYSDYYRFGEIDDSGFNVHRLAAKFPNCRSSQID